MPLGVEVGLGPGDFVPEKWEQLPTQFLAHVYCGQTAGWVETPVGTEVDLGPGHFVLDVDPGPPRKGHSSPRPFSVHVCGHGRPSQLLLSSCIALFMKHLASKMQFENFRAGIVGTRDHFHKK